MTACKHELLIASAGTGKTYRLTNQFLHLLLSGVEPERVLATTFTRKAAGEILDRLLARLVEAADSETGLTELREALEHPALSSAQCRALLVKLTRSLDTFQVRTIDSFFAHLIRLFAHDLELPANWTIADQREDEALQGEAMRDVLASIEPAEMLELLRDLQQGGAARGVQATLLRRARDLRPIAVESAEGAWSVLSVGDPIDMAAFEHAKRALKNAPVAKTAKGLDEKRWVASLASIADAIESERWLDILTKGLGQRSLDEDPVYCGKPLSPELLEILAPIVARAKAEVLSDLVARNEAVRALLERFETFYTARKRKAGRYQFDDLPMALAPRTARAQLFDAREAELWFRLDGRIDHLLLDEFQDTSPVQWRILQPLASEITSAGGGRSFFCVGDAKQSIYGFRQAEPRLLESLESLLPGLQVEFLDKSYRSSSVVLDLVNRIFGDLINSPAFVGENFEPYRTAAQLWSKRFSSHQAANTFPGVVHVIEARPRGDGAKSDYSTLTCAVERVARILEEAPHVEIGVLTRVNKNIPFLIHALRRQGIDASGEGGHPLTDSEAVLVFISLLHLIDHPSDSAAAFHVKTSRLGAYVDLGPDTDEQAVRRKARRLRSELLGRGLGVMTTAIANHVFADASWSDWDKARFAQLVEQAHAFEEKFTLRASEFVDHLRSNCVESPGGARVRVMTIHASKGLEFDAVVLPELAAKLVGPRDSVLTDRPDPTGLIETVSLSAGKELLSLSPELERLYHAATGKAVEDSLCSLYVAMTRAKRRIELILPVRETTKGDGSKVPTYAALIRGALPVDELVEDDPEGVLWRSRDNAAGDQWAADLAAPRDETEDHEPRLRLAETRSPRLAPRRSASATEGGASVRAGDLLRPGAGAAVGTLVHAAFEACEWSEDFAFDPIEFRRHAAPDAIVQTAQGIIERALASEQVCAALSRQACTAPSGTELCVLREHEFSLFLADDAGEPQFWNGAIDRLVLAKQDGRVVWAEVLDFKTDRVAQSELDQRVDYYRPQLEAYARVVAAQTGLAADQVKLRLVFLTMGRVIDLRQE